MWLCFVGSGCKYNIAVPGRLWLWDSNLF